MKYIKGFSYLNESNSPMPIIGFVFYFDGIFFYGAYPTFHEFAYQVAEYFGTDEGDRIYLDPYYLYEDIRNLFDYSESTANNFSSMVLWTGIKPKDTTNFSDTVSSGNPFLTCETLSKHFSDVKEVMAKYPKGNERDPIYLSLSIENNPSLIDQYSKYDESSPGDEYDENMFNLSDILKGIKGGSEDLKKMVKYLDIKRFI